MGKTGFEHAVTVLGFFPGRKSYPSLAQSPHSAHSTHSTRFDRSDRLDRSDC